MELKGQKKHETDSGGPSQHQEEKYVIAEQAMQKASSRFSCFDLQVVSGSSAGQQQVVSRSATSSVFLQVPLHLFKTSHRR